jgi:mannose-6-phosphate isomerase-like protein (cupin superfamily)
MRLIAGAGALTTTADGTPHWVEQFRVPDLSVGTYSIPAGGTDGQQPHTEDEIYVITAGQATLIAGPDGAQTSLPVQPGAVIYVPAREPHHFADITQDLAALVLFAPAEDTRAH